MARLSEWPRPLLKKWIALMLIGAACLATGVIMRIVHQDKILLVMSAILAAMTIVRCVFLFRRIGSGSYTTLEGVCVNIDWLPFQRRKRIRIITDQDEERSVYLDHRIRPSVGSAYRLYFMTDEPFPTDNSIPWTIPQAFAVETLDDFSVEDSEHDAAAQLDHSEQ